MGTLIRNGVIYSGGGSSGGEGGTTNYQELSNKPQINGTTLVGNKSLSDIGVPTSLSQLTEDANHRTTSDAEKSIWNSKSEFSGAYDDLTGKPTIPSTLSQLSGDTTHRTVTDAEKSTWNSKSNFSGSYNDLTSKPSIPSALSELTDDADHKTVTEAEKSKLSGIEAGANKTEIANNLTTTTPGKALDASQGALLFQSVSDGKSLIASAITDKGVQTEADATFSVMAQNIASIEGGDGKKYILKDGVFLGQLDVDYKIRGTVTQNVGYITHSGYQLGVGVYADFTKYKRLVFVSTPVSGNLNQRMFKGTTPSTILYVNCFSVDNSQASDWYWSTPSEAVKTYDIYLE